MCSASDTYFSGDPDSASKRHLEDSSMPDTEECSAVSLKLPTFWPQQPEVWIAQAEAQFSLRGITAEETKYMYVVSSLDQETAVRLLDIIKKRPATKPYETIKKRLLGTFTPSEYDRAGQLLHMSPLGDHKPSYMMDRMLALMGEEEPGFLFRRLFLERLPERIRTVLVHSGIKDPRQLADAADRLHDSFQSTDASAEHSINKVSTKRDKKEKSDKHKKDKDNGYCFYHSRFGKRAHRCEQPCSWPAENSTAGPQ